MDTLIRAEGKGGFLMFKRIFSFALVLVVMASMVSPAAVAAANAVESQDTSSAVMYDDFWNGTVTKIEPTGNEYIVTKASDLAWIAKAVNSGEITGEGYTIKLAANLNFRGYDWTPIGTMEHPFLGSFNGQGHTIGSLQPIGVMASGGREGTSGLFGVIVVKSGNLCSISNLNMVDNDMDFSADFATHTRAGSVAGEIRVCDAAALSIEKCNFFGTAIAGGEATVGGLIGKIITEGSIQILISDITSEIDVYANCGILAHAISGGLIGEIASIPNVAPANITIDRCKVDASLKARSVSGNTNADAGGLVGILKGGDVLVNECMVKGILYSEADTATVAGIFSAAHFSKLNLLNSFVETEFSTKGRVNNCIGGLLGVCECTGAFADSIIKNCYVNSSSDMGFRAGFIVRNSSRNQCINIESSYFDMNKMGVKSDEKVLYLEIFTDEWIKTDNISTSFGLSTDEIPFSQYFLGWDFDYVWTWDESGYPVLRAFNDGGDGGAEIVVESLVDRVKKYTSEFRQEDIDAIINGPGTEIEKANALLELYNQINDSMGEVQSFSTLTSNDLYASYLMMNRLRSTFGGAMARLVLGLNGLIYGEWKDHIIKDDPAYSKYKTLLSSFMKESRDEFELFSYISTTTKFLEGIAAVLEEQGVSDVELSKIIVEVRLADSISDVDYSLSKLSGKYTVSSIDLDLNAFDELFSKFGKAVDFADITYKSIAELSNLASSVECYHLYEDFLAFVASNDEFPSQLRAAAEDLNKTFEEQYSAAMFDYAQEVTKWLIDNSTETAGEIIFNDILIRNFGLTFSESIPGVNWGIVIVDSVLNMSEFVDSATYVEGYGLLQEEYTKKLLNDKAVFLESPSEENAKQFYRDYTLLWNLRDKGEEMFLQFAGYDGTWQGSVRQKLTFWIKYEELRQVTNVSRNYLTYSEFTFEDAVTTKSDQLYPFDQTVVVACPVDVNVYDKSGRDLLGKIEDGNAVKLNEEALLSLWSDGTQKIISMPSEMGYIIQVTATDEGTMDYYVSINGTADTPAYASRFADIPLEIGTQILNTADDNYRSLKIKTDTGEDVIVPAGDWQPDAENSSDYVQIIVPQSNGGTVYGANEYLIGTYVILSAYAEEGFKFNGWYENDTLISSDETLGFFVYANRKITARFDRLLPTPKVIVSIAPVENKTVSFGTTLENLDLPQYVNVVFEDGSTGSVDATWSSNPGYDGNTAGIYVFTGELQVSNGISNPEHLSAQLIVTVEAERPVRVPVTGIELNQQNVSLFINDTKELSAEVFPQNATNKKIHWSSSNPAIASVSDSGMVMAISTGMVTVTATTEDGGFTDTCVVAVSREDSGGSSSGGSTAGSSDRDYPISINNCQNGSVVVSKDYASYHDAVTISVTPDHGYMVESISVYGSNNKKVNLDKTGDGTYSFEMPASHVTIEVTFIPTTSEFVHFTDVPDGSWYERAVYYVYERGIMSGTGDAIFSPDLATSRAMFVTVLARLEGVDTTVGSTWYEAGQKWAMEHDISDGTNMDGSLTREQLVTMLWRYTGAPVRGSLSGYPDVANVSNYATQAMAWAVANGMISGMDGKLAPKGTATRAQVATILMRFVEQQA